jgi:hypothetical protein
LHPVALARSPARGGDVFYFRIATCKAGGHAMKASQAEAGGDAMAQRATPVIGFFRRRPTIPKNK